MATRTLRKEIRRPDEFVNASARALQYIQQHQRLAAWAGAGVVALLLAIITLWGFRQARWQQANTNLAQGMALFAQKKLPEASRVFDDLATQPNTPEEFAELGRLYSAQVQLEQGEFARAAAAFDAAQGGAGGFLQQRALVNHAFALEGNQQFADAATHFSEAAKAGGPYTAVAVMGSARNYERAGDAVKAHEAYQSYVSQFPEAADKELAESRLTLLP